MAWSLVTKTDNVGSWANNLPVTPALPSGRQAGDVMLCFASIKEDGATLSISTGWTPIVSLQATGLGEHSIAVWWRVHQSGDNAPTITPVGGGANDPVWAGIIAIRGPGTFDPSLLSYGEYGTFGSGPASEAITGPITGDALVMFTHMDNDNGGTMPSSYWDYWNGSSWAGWEYVTNGVKIGSETLTGSDAFAFVQPHIATKGTGSASTYYGGFLPSLIAGQTTFCWVLRVKQPSTTQTFTYSGAGGIKAGGACTSAYQGQTSTFSHVGAGGIIAGGAASVWPRQWTGAGGAKAGGAAITSFVNAPITGPVIRGKTAVQVCSTDPTVSLPSGSLAGDMLLVSFHVASGSGSATMRVENAAALGLTTITSGGWNPAGVFSYWKKLTPADIASGSMAFNIFLSSGYSGYMVLHSIYNVDWGNHIWWGSEEDPYFALTPIHSSYLIAGNPIGTQQGSYGSISPKTSRPNTLTVQMMDAAGVTTTKVNDSENDPWIQQHNASTTCGSYPNSGAIFTRLRLSENPTTTVTTSPNLVTFSASGTNAHCFAISIAGLGLVTLEAPPGAGGAIAGGAALTSYEAAVATHIGTGGAIIGGTALAQAWPIRYSSAGGITVGGLAGTEKTDGVVVPTYTLTARLRYAANVKGGASGYTITATHIGSGQALPLESLRLRRESGFDALGMATPRRFALPLAGELEIVMARIYGGTAVPVWRGTFEITRFDSRLDAKRTTIEAARSGRAGAVRNWVERELYRGSGSFRVRPLLEIKPGDTVNGETVVRSSTAIGPTANFSEVFTNG